MGKTAILVTIDEGGGYYDSGYIQILDFFGDGTRIPLIAVSPFAKKGYVDHTYYDHVSVLKFIERNWRWRRYRRAAATTCRTRKCASRSLRPGQPTGDRRSDGPVPVLNLRTGPDTGPVEAEIFGSRFGVAREFGVRSVVSKLSAFEHAGTIGDGGGEHQALLG